ncbi:MAG: hypothetical protein LBQ64_00640 [Bacteroidales bacterium]|jgi:hypothetical protein|nr:hypothetical protein [Bacteroidales bacterium]
MKKYNSPPLTRTAKINTIKIETAELRLNKGINMLQEMNETKLVHNAERIATVPGVKLFFVMVFLLLFYLFSMSYCPAEDYFLHTDDAD